MFATMAAEFGASGAFTGSFVFHGRAGENPLSGRSSAYATPPWPASAGAAQSITARQIAEIIDPHLLIGTAIVAIADNNLCSITSFPPLAMRLPRHGQHRLKRQDGVAGGLPP